MDNTHSKKNLGSILMTFYEDRIHLKASFSLISNWNMTGLAPIIS